MLSGLLLKGWRETRTTTLSLMLAVAVVTGIITLVLPQLVQGLNDFVLQVPFIRSMVSAMTGIDVSTGLTTTMLLSVMWTHPVMLALVWWHAIALCARYPAGEIDRGTIDVLLGWPVSRRGVWRAETLIWLGSGTAVVIAALTGYGLASLTIPPDARPTFARAAMAAVNLYALYCAAGAATLLASSLSNRQSRAMAAGFAVVAGSFLLNFLVPYWRAADALSFLGLMSYYRPAIILRDGIFPSGDVVVLLGTAAVLWTVGMEVTARRNIATD
jgi:ABC-type transport system involved in multi-copper enzyme maturation permease subunit